MKNSGRKRRNLSLISLAALNLAFISLPFTTPELNVQANSVEISQTEKKQLPDEPIQAFLVDKARYNPGEKVTMSLLFNTSAEWKGKLNLEVYHINEKVAEGKKNIQVKKGLKGIEIEWTPPKEDFRGYLVKASVEGSNQILTAAIDVSSDWTRFPRYGYATEFPKETANESDKKLKQLTQEYYLNSFQFYDWMWRHDVSVYSKTDSNGKPILDENGEFIAEKIDSSTAYDDLLGRKLYPLSVKQQIKAAQKYNAAAMAYQMNYAARENYEDFGVKKEWGLYRRNAQFPNPKLSDQEGFIFDWANTGLYLQNPGNPEWQKYINKEFTRSVNEFGFDGMHLDQWGAHDNDYLYDYTGKKRYYSKDYDSLINSVKESLVKNNENKSFVTFNMVGGNEGYKDVPVPATQTDFDYSEIWQDKDNYRDLLKVVEETRETNGGKAVVIAGYMNYKQAAGDHYEVSDVKGIPRIEQTASSINKVPGWVGDFGKKDEDQIIWTIDVPEAGTYDIALKYGHNNSDSPEGKLLVNDRLAAEKIPFNEKTGWGNPVAEQHLSLNLVKGTNEIKLQLNTNDLWLNVDSVVLKKSLFEKEYEAEDAELVSCKVDKHGHVFNFEVDGDFIEFTALAEKDGSYPISFGYGVERVAVNRHLYVNDKLVTDAVKFEPTGGWENFQNSQDIEVPLKAGENKVVLKVEGATDTGAKVDYMAVGNTRYQAEKAAIGWKPTKQPIIEKSNDGIHHFKQQGDFVSFSVDSDKSIETPLVIYYKNPGIDTQRSVIVNGKKAGLVTFPQTLGDEWGKAKANIYLYEGKNEIQVKMEKESVETGIEMDKFELGNEVKESEQAQIGWNPVVVKTPGITVSPGQTDRFGKKGQRVIFTVNNEKETDTLRFKYRSGNNPQVNIYVDGTLIPAKNAYVDGKTVSENQFSSTPGGWSGSMVEKAIKATVPAGEHEVVFELASDGEYINLDSLLIGDVEYQVEEARFAPEGHGVTTSTGHVYDFKEEGDFLTFEVNAPQAGNYDLLWRYNNDSESKRTANRAVFINNVKTETVRFPYSNAWENAEMNGVPLQKGNNKITIIVENVEDDGVKLDFLQMGSTKYHAESATSLPPMHIFKDTLMNFGHTGDEVSFNIDLKEGGETSFIFTYSNAGADTVRTIYIDGKPVLDENGKPHVVTFRSTGKADSYSEDGYIVLPELSSGKHQVTLKQEDGQKGTIQLRRMTIGLFDEPSVRLMDVGLAAMGATHIEIGTAEEYEEGPNMLAHEYYPNRSKKMTESLKESMKDYYKFFAAYENLLFDSKISDAEVEIENGGETLKVSRDGESNTIWSIVRNNQENKGFEDYEVVHLINLLNNDQNWRNAAAKPAKLDQLTLRYPMEKSANQLPDLKVYTASPDRNEGQLREIPYKWDNTDLMITLPGLEYWEMIMIDRDGLQNKKPVRIK
ncbi:carbohydrate-binding protein [Mesobacillus foraminis]|uniref:glycoside hydrolase family 66 protein n=1 Tax=Mesobacillus foraminis TaxID=279826 RepID=UPI001BE7147A|nr:glycoside hydrolase family 66 protein [Mesobacillus foraminis]MBT2755838.1 carbohydrate-binding protein [Mesobacillus foraminis]